MELKGPRWKGKDSASIASSNPMSGIITRLQSSLLQSKSPAYLCGLDVLLEAGPEETDLLKRSCFGQSIGTAEKDKQLFQLDFEEAFYLCHALRCLEIFGEDKRPMDVKEIWELMKSKKKMFPGFYKAYYHLRRKNWVVRAGALYGSDFVLYHHHPALVHSGYAAIVLTEGNADENARLSVWSNWEAFVRVSGTVAKTLLVITINDNASDAAFPLCLESYTVEERAITRWNPDKHREDQSVAKNGI
ncbi:tRNA-splicing endonuclease subunit Sen2-1-like [Aristolochia californica]|uniref:tRNA-splicing endonuclease subunit Sen2-1-like n=1 Tax=Aristolochia californica TaxID=171875 RepID=UPI0035D8FF65